MEILGRAGHGDGNSRHRERASKRDGKEETYFGRSLEASDCGFQKALLALGQVLALAAVGRAGQGILDERRHCERCSRVGAFLESHEWV